MSKLNFLIALLVLGLVSCAVAATPPACILACVSKEKQASDFKAVCAAQSVQDCLAKACDNGEFKTAVSSFEQSCKEGGYSVAQPHPSATATGSRSSSATAGASASAKPDSAGGRAAGGSTLGVFLAAVAAVVLI